MSEKYTDALGDTWFIRLNVGNARRVKDSTGIDLLNVTEVIDGRTSLDVLSSDPFALTSVLFILSTSDTVSNLTENAFAERFDGATIERATDALMKEIVNFSPPAKRIVLARIHALAKDFAGKKVKEIEKLTASPEFATEIEKAWNRSAGSSVE